MQKLNEECGVLGFYDNDGYNVAHMLYTGMFALQHRGQQSCGIVTNDDAHLHQVKDKGLVSEVFDENVLSPLTGNIGVAHVRYAKEGDTLKENAQPLVSRYCMLAADLYTFSAASASTNDRYSVLCNSTGKKRNSAYASSRKLLRKISAAASSFLISSPYFRALSPQSLCDKRK